MNKLLIYTLLATLALGLSVFHLFKQNEKNRKDRDKYKENTSALLSNIKRMQIDSATSAVDAKTLRLTLDEYKSYRAQDIKKIEKLGIRIKSLQAVAKHEAEVDAPIDTQLKDTVTIRAKIIELNTPYLQISGIIENNQLKGNINLPVTLHQAVWVEHKRRFLWWRWGVKAVHQTISSDNPHVKVKYSEMIKIEK